MTPEQRRDWLARLKVGDSVRECGTSMMAVRSYDRPATVKRATKQFVTVGVWRYRRSDGTCTTDRKDGHGWSRSIQPTA